MLPFLPFLTPFLYRNCSSFLSLVISLCASSSSYALLVTSYLLRSCTYCVNRLLIASTSFLMMALHIPFNSYNICETHVSVIAPLNVSLIFCICLTASVGIHSFYRFGPCKLFEEAPRFMPSADLPRLPVSERSVAFFMISFSVNS